MTLSVFNTMGSRKEPFVPLVPGKIRMYVCGVTVYDLCHIGHARANVAFDIIVRYLRHAGYDVTYIRNFTDIDDKIIRKANQEGIPFAAVTKKYIDAFYEDFDRLGLLRRLAQQAVAHLVVVDPELLLKRARAQQALDEPTDLAEPIYRAALGLAAGHCERLHLQAERGERRPEFVCRVGNERAFVLHRGRKARQEVVQRVHDRPHFVREPGGRQRIERHGTARADRAGQLTERLQGAADDPPDEKGERGHEHAERSERAQRQPRGAVLADLERLRHLDDMPPCKDAEHAPAPGRRIHGRRS